MKPSTLAKKLGYFLCFLGACSAVLLFWQLFAFESSPVPCDMGWLCYLNMACVVGLPVVGVALIRYSVTLMLQCR